MRIEVCRENGIGESTFYKWKSKYGGLEINEARRLKTLEDENAKLKRVVADLTLNKLALRERGDRSARETGQAPTHFQMGHFVSFQAFFNNFCNLSFFEVLRADLRECKIVARSSRKARGCYRIKRFAVVMHEHLLARRERRFAANFDDDAAGFADLTARATILP